MTSQNLKMTSRSFRGHFEVISKSCRGHFENRLTTMTLTTTMRPAREDSDGDDAEDKDFEVMLRVISIEPFLDPLSPPLLTLLRAFRAQGLGHMIGNCRRCKACLDNNCRSCNARVRPESPTSWYASTIIGLIIFTVIVVIIVMVIITVIVIVVTHHSQHYRRHHQHRGHRIVIVIVRWSSSSSSSSWFS